MTKVAPSGRSGTRTPVLFSLLCATVTAGKACFKDLVFVGLPLPSLHFLCERLDPNIQVALVRGVCVKREMILVLNPKRYWGNIIPKDKEEE